MKLFLVFRRLVQIFLLRNVWSALVFPLCLFVSAHAGAYSGQATDDAFAALFSMPGAGPANGYWDFPVPEDFTASNENKLIAYLEKKQKAGADFNAYRHFGTLLHHAIRAGQVKTATWLLSHGSDPRKPLIGTKTNALSLSQEYGRKSLTTLLKSKYGLEPQATARQTERRIEPDLSTLVLTYQSPSDFALARKALYQTSLWANTLLTTPQQVRRAQEEQRKWQILKANMPPGVYTKVMDDDSTLSSLVRMVGRVPKDLEKELAALPIDVLRRHSKAALAALAEQSGFSVSSGKNPKISFTVLPQSWQTLWRFLGRPLDYSALPGLAEKIQPELWTELYATGYANRNPETALGCMLSQISANDLKILWPRILENFPNIRQVAPRMVLSHYRMVASTGYCWSWEQEETKNKLLFLTSIGVKGQVLGIIGHSLQYESPDLLAAMKPFSPHNQPVSKPRFVDRKPECNFKLTDVWYKELLDKGELAIEEEGDQRAAVDTVQLIEIPGETECGLLVGGYGRGDYVSGDIDSFTGPESNPTPSCPDPADRYEVWRHKDGRIERLKSEMGSDDGAPSLIPVRDTKTGQNYYLHTGEQYGQCHGRRRLPFVFEWNQSSGGWALLNSKATDLEDALFDQCNAEDDLRCYGIAALTPGTEISKQIDQRTVSNSDDAYKIAISVPEFIKTFRTPQYRQYLSAIQNLDKKVLATMQAEGVPADWTTEAIRQVGASELSIAEKRKRTAWIFYDHKQLARALSSNVLESLLGWLPREDWNPVFSIISQQPSMYYDLQFLREAATEKGLNSLACDIDHARGLICGEKWRTDR